MNACFRFSAIHATLLCCVPWVGILLSGCGDGTRADSVREGTLPHEVLLERPSGESLRYRSSSDVGGGVVVTRSGVEVPVVGGEATIGDTIVVVGRDGQTTVHRTPDAIVAESNNQPTTYLKLRTGEPVIVERYRGAAMVDPTDGEVCWIALTCTADACTEAGENGGPLQFASPEAGANVAQDGRITFVADSTTSDAFPKCPHCGKDSNVKKYESPQVATRRVQLLRELNAVRAARSQRAK